MENQLSQIRRLVNLINMKIYEPFLIDLNLEKTEVYFYCVGEVFTEYMPLEVAIGWLEGAQFAISNVDKRRELV